MAWRFVTSWIRSIIDFANCRIVPHDWKQTFYRLQTHRLVADEFWKEDSAVRDAAYVRQLQRRIRRYLSQIAQPEGGDSRQVKIGNLLEDLEDYGNKEGFVYSMVVVPEAEFKSNKQFPLINQTNEIRMPDGKKIRIGKFARWNSFEQYLYTCLAQAVESREILKVGRCQFSRCRNFAQIQRKTKRFCKPAHRLEVFRNKPGQKERARKNQRDRRSRAKGEAEEKAQQDKAKRVIALFESFVERTRGQNNVNEDDLQLLKIIGQGAPLVGWKRVREFDKELKGGVSYRTLWNNLAPAIKARLEPVLLKSP